MDCELTDRLGDALLRLKGVNTLLSDRMDMSLFELSVLRRLAENRTDSDSNVFAYDLAAEFHTSKAGVSQLLNSMERRGLVRRNFNPSNRRKLIITLTDDGQRMVIDAERMFVEAMDRVIRAYGEENARALADQLERLFNVLDQQGKLTTRGERSSQDE